MERRGSCSQEVVRKTSARCKIRARDRREVGGKNGQQAVREGPIRSAARASALASAVRIRNHGPAPPLHRNDREFPGVPRMGTNGSTMLEPLRQGLPPLDPSAVSSAASCALPARYEAVREARQFTRRTLDQWDIGDRFDDVCLVVSELVTNALRHALPANT